MTEPLPPSPLLPLCGQSLSTQHGTPEATGSRPAPSATPRQGHTSALPRVSRSASLPGEGLGAWSLTSGSSDHSAGRSWPRRVDAVGRPGVFSGWLENCYEREEGEAPSAPSSHSLLQRTPSYGPQVSKLPLPSLSLTPCCPRHPKPGKKK